MKDTHPICCSQTQNRMVEKTHLVGKFRIVAMVTSRLETKPAALTHHAPSDIYRGA